MSHHEVSEVQRRARAQTRSNDQHLAARWHTLRAGGRFMTKPIAILAGSTLLATLLATIVFAQGKPADKPAAAGAKPAAAPAAAGAKPAAPAAAAAKPAEAAKPAAGPAAAAAAPAAPPAPKPPAELD